MKKTSYTITLILLMLFNSISLMAYDLIIATSGEFTYNTMIDEPHTIAYSGEFTFNTMIGEINEIFTSQLFTLNTMTGPTYTGYSDYFSFATQMGHITGTITNAQSGNPIEGAIVNTVQFSSTPSDEEGHYHLYVPFGYGYQCFAIAENYETQYFSGNVNVPMQNPEAEVNFQLTPVPVEIQFSTLDPDPNPEVSIIQQGGKLYRYYQLTNGYNGSPLTSKVVKVTGDGFEKNYLSDEDGEVKIEIQSNEIGDGEPGATESFTIISVSGEPLVEPVEFVCEVYDTWHQKYWDANGWIKGGFKGFSGGVDNSGLITLEELDPNIPDPENLMLKRTGRWIAGVDWGASLGLEINAGEINTGAFGGGEAGLNLASVTQDEYLFTYNDLSFEEKYASLYLMLSAFVKTMDVPLKHLTTQMLIHLQEYVTGNVLEDAGQFELSGIQAGGNAGAAVEYGFLNHSFEKAFGIGSDVNLEGSINGHFTMKNYTDSDLFEPAAGISLEIDGDQNNKFIDLPGVEYLINLLPYLEECGLDGGVTGEVAIKLDFLTNHIEEIRLVFTHRLNGTEHLKVFSVSGENLEYLVSDLPFLQKLNAVTENNVLQVQGGLISKLLKSFFRFVFLQQNAGLDVKATFEHYISSYESDQRYSADLGFLVGSLGVGSLIEEGKVKLKQRGEFTRGKIRVTEEYDNNIPEIETEIPINTYMTLANIASVLYDFYQIASLTMPFAKDGEFYIGDQGSYLTYSSAVFPAFLDSITCSSWSWYGNAPSKDTEALSERDKLITSFDRKQTEEEYGMTFGYGGFYQFEPYGTELLDTCWMTIVYDQAEVDSIDESSLGMYWEDKANHRWVYLGGVLDTVANIVTAPITELSLFTLAPAMPYGSFGLNALPDSIYADSISTALISSDTIFNNNLTPVSNGEKFTVGTTYGKIITPDADTTIDGIQVIATDHQIQFEVQSSHIGGKATISAFSVNGSANASTELRYYDTIPPAAPVLAEVIPDSTTTDLFWLPNTEDDMSGYVIYFDTDTIPPFDGIHTVYGQPSPIYTGTDTSRTVYGLFNDSTYYFTLTAVDVEGNESAYSNFVQATPWAPERQTIQLAEGWSGISTYVLPETDNVESMFESIFSDLIILQNETGMYWPGQNINTLGSWDTHEGYQVKVADNVELTISGAHENNKALQLATGWNLIPVLSECEVDVAALFDGVDVVIVKEIAGWNIYWPEFGINTLGILQPGSAYFVLMNAEAEITFPACDGLKSSTLNGAGSGSGTRGKKLKASPDLSAFEITKTAFTHTIAVPAGILNLSGFQNLTGLIAANDANGHCFGAGHFDSHNTSITLFGDDLLTAEKDGFAEGEGMYFELLVPESDQRMALKVEYNQALPQHNGKFQTNGLSAIAALKAQANGIQVPGLSGIEIFPNPAKELLNIRVDAAHGQKFEIIDMKGQLLLEGEIAGRVTEVKLGSLQSGIYMLKISTVKGHIIKRFVKY